MQWKYTSGNQSVFITNPDGSEVHTTLEAIADWIAKGNTPLPADQPTQAERIASAILKIDADTDAIYGAVLGNRAQEYIQAEADATAYKSAGYTGTVPAGVQCWATAKNWTATQAADDILATSTAWKSAQETIRAQRLSSKEVIRKTIDPAGVLLELGIWSSFATEIKAQVGLQ